MVEKRAKVRIREEDGGQMFEILHFWKNEKIDQGIYRNYSTYVL
jgi:hypothetical protein